MTAAERPMDTESDGTVIRATTECCARYHLYYREHGCETAMNGNPSMIQSNVTAAERPMDTESDGTVIRARTECCARYHLYYREHGCEMAMNGIQV